MDFEKFKKGAEQIALINCAFDLNCKASFNFKYFVLDSIIVN